jgi:SAM-dependent methyltransferase
MDRYWDDLASGDDSGWHENDSRWKARMVQTMLAKHALEPRTLCDIGCGTAGVLNALADLLPNVDLVGYEPSAEALRLIPGAQRSGLTLIHGPCDIDDRRFDVALCFDVFEHVENPFAFLRVVRSKAPIVIFNIPLDLNALNACRPAVLLHAREAIGHIHYFSAETALALLSDTGFEVLDVTYSDFADDRKVVGSRGSRLAQSVRRVGARISPALTARFLGGLSLFVVAKASRPVGAPRT